MISSTVAVEELNAFILPGISSFTDLFLMPLSEVHQYCWLGTSLLYCLQIVCFGDQSAISIDKKGVGFSASLTEVIQSCREFLWVAGLLLNLTTEVVSYLGGSPQPMNFLRFARIVLVCTLSVLQSQVFGILYARHSYCILYHTLLTIFSYKERSTIIMLMT